jgi:exopolyphosphatase/guanosine-5'-triphosphate,3'-diphosphate pyrophosphatase
MLDHDILCHTLAFDMNFTPLSGQRLAAIDIGSNAIRMVIVEVKAHGLDPIKKYRFPIRLGADVFRTGKISSKNLKESARTFEKFSSVADKYGIARLRAIGTSALREATNSAAYVELIRRKSGIKIEIIDGKLEAQLVHRAVRQEVGLDQSQAVLIDIGGGSVEVTFSNQGKIEATQSFPFGTVRTLELLKRRHLEESQINLVIGDFIRPLSQFVHANTPSKRLDFAVGTGGNLETLGKLKPILLGLSSKTEMTDLELESLIQKLRKMTVKDRITRFEMRPDRADVIVPAALVVQAILRQASVHRLLMPAVGLKDGVLLSLVDSQLAKK